MIFIRVYTYIQTQWIHNVKKSTQNSRNEPRHDKTNNVAVRPSKTQISLGIRPVCSESSMSAWSKIGSLATH